MNPFFHALLANFDSQEATDITLNGETLAYTWFGRPNYAYSEEAQKYWIGSTKDTPEGTTQHVTQYDINSNSYITTRVGIIYQKDDHNQTQILIRQSDKRLLAFFVEHNGGAIRWKISVNPLDSTEWGPLLQIQPTGGYSYISPYQASNGNIFIIWRTSISGPGIKWYIMKSTDGGETFVGLQEIYNNGGTQSYLITSQDGDKLQFAASDGHPAHTSNVSVYHFYFDMINETAHKTDGTTIAFPLAPSALTSVYIPTGSNRTWILDVTVKNGNPRIIFAFYTGSSINKSLYFSEWDGNQWSTPIKISDTLYGFIETDSSIQEAFYTGASRFDTSNPDIIWMPKETLNNQDIKVLEIHKVNLAVSPISIEQVTFNSKVNNWRPISIPSPINNLIWLKNNQYNMYTDYSITLQTKTVQV